MKKQSKNIFLAFMLCSATSVCNTAFAQELQPTLLTAKEATTSQHFKKVRQNKTLALRTVKRAAAFSQKAPKQQKGQYLIHGSLPSDRFDAQ